MVAHFKKSLQKFSSSTHLSCVPCTSILFCLLFCSHVYAQSSQFSKNEKNYLERTLNSTIVDDPINGDYVFYARNKGNEKIGVFQYLGGKNIQTIIPQEMDSIGQLQNTGAVIKSNGQYGFYKAWDRQMGVPPNFKRYYCDGDFEGYNLIAFQNKNHYWGVYSLNEDQWVIPFLFKTVKAIPKPTNSFLTNFDTTAYNKSIKYLQALPKESKKINLKGFNLTFIHPNVAQFKRVEELNLHGNHLSEFPKELNGLKLTTLDYRGNTYTERLTKKEINAHNSLKVFSFGSHYLPGRWPLRQHYTPLFFDSSLFSNSSFEKVICNYRINKSDLNPLEWICSLPKLKQLEFQKGGIQPFSLISPKQWACRKTLEYLRIEDFESIETTLASLKYFPNIKRIHLNSIKKVDLKKLKDIPGTPEYINIVIWSEIEDSGRWRGVPLFTFDNTLGYKERNDFLSAIEEYQKSRTNTEE